MSSVPVQFLIHVISPASCSVLPLLTGTNVTDSTCVGVQATVPYTSILFASNLCGPTVTIVDISLQALPGMITGPLTMINSSFYSRNLTWTPSALQLGLKTMCAIALDRQESKLIDTNCHYLLTLVKVNDLNNSVSPMPLDRELMEFVP